MKSNIALILVLVAVICACNKKDGENSKHGGTGTSLLIPLKTGNYWEFLDSTFSNGSVINVDTSRLSIAGSKYVSHEGKNYLVYIWTWANPASMNDGFFANNESDGLHFYGGTADSTDFFLTTAVALKYPVQPGDTWEKPDVVFGGSVFYISDTTTVQCISTDSLFRTSAGNLACITYNYVRPMTRTLQEAFLEPGSIKSTANGSYDFTLFYKPGIGYVGSVQKINGDITFKKSLLAFKLN